MPNVTYMKTGGMNTSEFPTRLRDGEATLLQNVEFGEQHVWSMRKGYLAVGDKIAADPTIVELVNFIKNDGTDYLCALASGKLYALTAFGGTFAAGLTLVASGDFDFDTFNNLLLIARRTSTMQKFDGTTVALLGGSPPSSVKAVRAFKNFVFLLGNNSSRLYFSALGNAESWTTGTDYIDVNTDDGDWGTGLGVLGDQLLIFKRYNTYALYGYSKKTFEVIPFLSGMGCVNHRSIQEIGNGIIWQSDKKILRLQGGELDEISRPIRKTVSDMGQSFKGKSAYYPEKNQYWLPIDENNDGVSDAVLVFDITEEKWTRYSGMTFESLCATTISSGTKPKTLVAGGYTNGLIYRLDYGTSDATAAIAFEIDSGEMDCGAPFVDKGFRDVWVWLYVTATTIRPTLDYLIDGVAVETGVVLTPQVAAHMYAVHVNLIGSGRVIQFKVKHTATDGGRLHVGGWTIGFVGEGAYH